jgi:hypothetical protein
MEKDWGLFRLLHDANTSFLQTTEKGNEFLLSWKYTAVNPPGEFEWFVKLSTESGVNPFAKTFFQGFAPKEGMIR